MSVGEGGVCVSGEASPGAFQSCSADGLQEAQSAETHTHEGLM